MPFLTSNTVTTDEAVRLYRETKAARLVRPTLAIPHGWEWESRQAIEGGFRIIATQGFVYE